MGIVTGTCPDDVDFEDNDSSSAAAGVTAGIYADLGICPGDDDYYELTLESGDELEVELIFSDGEGDLDLFVYDPSTTLFGVSTSNTDDETVGPDIAALAGEYLIEVIFQSDGGSFVGNTYEMHVTVNGLASICVDDAFEDNEEPGDATPVAAGSYPDLEWCDLDLYAIDLDAGDSVTIDATFTHAEGNIDIELGDLAGNPLASSTSTTDDETIGPVSIPSSDTYILAVDLVSDDADIGNAYDLTIAVTP